VIGSGDLDMFNILWLIYSRFSNVFCGLERYLPPRLKQALVNFGVACSYAKNLTRPAITHVASNSWRPTCKTWGRSILPSNHRKCFRQPLRERVLWDVCVLSSSWTRELGEIENISTWALYAVGPWRRLLAINWYQNKWFFQVIYHIRKLYVQAPMVRIT
jgi:hypothetical protein